MTGEEKRQQLKEQFKQDLLLRKQFLDKAKELRQSQTMSKAITDLTSALNMDETDAWIELLNRESALAEAKLEMSFDLAEEAGPNLLQQQAMEAEQQKLSAAMLVEQMKRQMGLLPEEPSPAPESAPAETAPDAAPEAPPERPAKKLGDF